MALSTVRFGIINLMDPETGEFTFGLLNCKGPWNEEIKLHCGIKRHHIESSFDKVCRFIYHNIVNFWNLFVSIC